jgi:membrane protein
MLVIIKAKQWLNILKETVSEFLDDNSFHYAAALSYYTIFSLPPILIIVILIAGSIFGEDAAGGEVYNQLHNLLGHESAIQIQEMVKQAGQLEQNLLAQVIGTIALLITSTGVFISLQDALNVIWKVRSRPKSNILKLLQNRLLSFSMILTIGFLLLISLIVHATVVGLSGILHDIMEDATFLLMQSFNILLPLAFATLLFALIFKILPDVKIQWKDVWAGAFFTAVLFTIGKYLISLYMSNVNIASAYGAAGTVIVLLTWIFYSSLILLFGAQFTKVYSKTFGKGIHPTAYAVRLETKIIEDWKPMS